MPTILDNLNEKVVLAVSQPPEDCLDELRSFSRIELPSDYVELIRLGSDFEFQADGWDYFRIWGAAGCIEMNTAYLIQDRIPGGLGIGDDEGGRALVWCPSKVDPPGLYIVDFGDMFPESLEFVAPTLRDVLENGTGVRLLSKKDYGEE